eukprot:m.159943 g.159943  ORF g.159943 m.159943 type:complete len:307 (-) comp20923_c2_seq7:29-949(-)
MTDFWSALFPCFGGGVTYTLHAHQVVRKRQLSEGGFAVVELVQDVRDKKEYALKRVTCADEAQFQVARREMDYYKLFDHPNVVPCVDTGQTTDRSGNKEVLMLFPLYTGGTLHDLVRRHAARGERFGEHELLRIFKGVCMAVLQLHSCRQPYPLAHRDIKTMNVMMHQDQPVLIDFGSAEKAEIVIRTRQEALICQDRAAEYSCLPYRAPELFDIPSDTVITAKTDIWSLGCLLYTMAFHETPFEAVAGATGSLQLAIVQGRVKYPERDAYSDELKVFIESMLETDPAKRPDINDVLNRTEALCPG